MRDLEGRPSSYIGNLEKSEDLNANFRSRYRTMENTLTLCRLGASFCICYVNGHLQRKGMLETTVVVMSGHKDQEEKTVLEVDQSRQERKEWNE